jgi:hypothetical protein
MELASDILRDYPAAGTDSDDSDWISVSSSDEEYIHRQRPYFIRLVSKYFRGVRQILHLVIQVSRIFWLARKSLRRPSKMVIIFAVFNLAVRMRRAQKIKYGRLVTLLLLAYGSKVAARWSGASGAVSASLSRSSSPEASSLNENIEGNEQANTVAGRDRDSWTRPWEHDNALMRIPIQFFLSFETYMESALLILLLGILSEREKRTGYSNLLLLSGDSILFQSGRPILRPYKSEKYIGYSTLLLSPSQTPIFFQSDTPISLLSLVGDLLVETSNELGKPSDTLGVLLLAGEAIFNVVKGAKTDRRSRPTHTICAAGRPLELP